jgi:hypothetical protein
VASLTTDDLQTLGDWLYVTRGPYRLTGWSPGPSNDGRIRLQPVRKLIDASESDVMHYGRTFHAVSVQSAAGGEIKLPRTVDTEDVFPLSLSDTLEELGSWPDHLLSALPDTVLASLDMCEGGQRLADVIEEVAEYLRDLHGDIVDRGFDRKRLAPDIP